MTKRLAILTSALLALSGCTQVFSRGPDGGPMRLRASYLTLPIEGTTRVYPPPNPVPGAFDRRACGPGAAAGLACPEIAAEPR